jgi:hypothetical protein
VFVASRSVQEPTVEPEAVELASAAATTLVTLLATDAWGQVKDGFGALWRRFRPEEAAGVEADLTAGHAEALAGDGVVLRALALSWESRLLRLMAADADAVADLRRVVTDLAGRHGNITIRQRANATDHSTVIQVAGDARIGEPPATEFRRHDQTG